MKKIVGKNNNNFYGLLFSVFLWLCIWATYDTDVSRFFIPGFPHSLLDLVHGLRSLLPFFALLVSVVILIKQRNLSKKIFTTPLGLLGIFTFVGIISSIFSKNILMAFYWGVLYGSVIIFLLTIINDKPAIKRIIFINLTIAGVLALGLTGFFLPSNLFFQPLLW